MFFFLIWIFIFMKSDKIKYTRMNDTRIARNVHISYLLSLRITQLVEKTNDGWKWSHGLTSRKNAWWQRSQGTNVQMEMVSGTHKCKMEMVSRAHLEEKQRYRGPKRIWQWSHELINAWWWLSVGPILRRKKCVTTKYLFNL